MKGCKHCSCYATQEERDNCVSELREDWNGLCAFQRDGCTVEDWDEEIVPDCADGCSQGGCEMDGQQYARWNGLCAYQRPIARVDLSWQDLHAADLHGADLHGADLRGADLYYADLHGADLRGADLRWACLIGTDLRGADLDGADLSQAIVGTE